MSELDVLLEAVALKALSRAGWVRKGVPAPESVAAHSWGVAWLVLALLPPELSRERALTYAVLHDLAEVRVGDLTPHDGVGALDKQARESAALASLLGPVPGGSALEATWHAYEAQQDDEARFVRQLDRLDMALQAVVYQAEVDADLQEFLDSAARVVTHPRLVPLLTALGDRLHERRTLPADPERGE